MKREPSETPPEHSWVTEDPWADLKGLTGARIALGRAGGSLPTRAWLDFKLSHAKARDAVHCDFDVGRIETACRKLKVDSITVESQAVNRTLYLQRPDLGRLLSNKARSLIRTRRGAFDGVIIVSDGLSAAAVHEQVPPLLTILLPQLMTRGWTLAPIVIARFGRVALQDDIGAMIGADMALILLGERPGLGSPDSLGAYLVYGPKVGNTDAERNCVSNIRTGGLDHRSAADVILYLLNESRTRKISGIALKDERRILPASAASQGTLGGKADGE